MTLTVLEICAGAGGQALGLERAGFSLEAAVEIDRDACNTLLHNRPAWTVLRESVKNIDGKKYRGLDLLAGGVPCPPFSIAGKQLGEKDDRDLFPEALRLIREARPAAVLLENVPGFASAKFDQYRRRLLQRISALGYRPEWRVLNACWFGVPQFRRRFVLVAFKKSVRPAFVWPEPSGSIPPILGDALVDVMASRGWRGAQTWRHRAIGIAPTLVGGSKKHGGPDLGPTRAKRQWVALGVDPMGIADEPPGPHLSADFAPRLTVRMAARIQGFSDSWVFTGGKTSAYRQVGNAFPPPMAHAVAGRIRAVLLGEVSDRRLEQIPLFAEAN